MQNQAPMLRRGKVPPPLPPEVREAMTLAPQRAQPARAEAPAFAAIPLTERRIGKLMDIALASQRGQDWIDGLFEGAGVPVGAAYQIRSDAERGWHIAIAAGNAAANGESTPAGHALDADPLN